MYVLCVIVITCACQCDSIKKLDDDDDDDDDCCETDAGAEPVVSNDNFKQFQLSTDSNI